MTCSTDLNVRNLTSAPVWYVRTAAGACNSTSPTFIQILVLTLQRHICWGHLFVLWLYNTFKILPFLTPIRYFKHWLDILNLLQLALCQLLQIKQLACVLPISILYCLKWNFFFFVSFLVVPFLNSLVSAVVGILR